MLNIHCISTSFWSGKDHKFKRSADNVNVCVKTLEKVVNEGGDPIPALKHLKFISDKVAKGFFNF